jgi:capsular exopolysaccharide synthesis family protein
MSLRRRWRLILACTLLLPAATALALSHVPPRYTAIGVMLYDPAAGAPPGDAISPAPEGDPDQDAIIASQSAIITSLPAAAAIATQLNLAARPEFNPALRHRPWLLKRFLPVRKPQPGSFALAARNALAVAVVTDSRIIAVSFTSRDPVLAAAAANLAMQLYFNHERDQSYADLNNAQSWLEANAVTLQTQLAQTETALAAARAAAGIIPGDQASLTTETASRITASLVDAQAVLAMAQARLASATNGDAAEANAAIAPNLLPLRKEQADLTAQVKSLAGQYGANYPDLLSANASLGAITSEINAEMARELDAANAEVAADKAQVATLAGALSSARAESMTEDAESTPIRVLEQRADSDRDMLHSMTLQADNLAQQSALTKPAARILSNATPPATPSWPHPKLVIPAAAALGLCLGLLLAGLRDALDTSFRSGSDLRAELGLICLALVPEIQAPRAAPLTAPFSVFSEQMRALRTGLSLGATHTSPPCIIAITAARPGEGKTTLTIALARALAITGLRVLAVDADIRQPSFDAVFAAAGAAGLTDHLSNLTPLDEIILPDHLSPLHIIPAGTQTRDALSLFLSPALPAMFTELRTRYDVVLLDVPPAFALAESRVLSRAADAALLCIRWGNTPSRVVRAAITLLREANVNLVGAVLTRVNATQHGRSGFPDAEIYQPRYGGYFRS